MESQDHVPEPSESTRFAYVAKASRAERNAGLEGFEKRPRGEDVLQNHNGERRADPPVANFHPTVKPIALMRWLVRLVTPPGGFVLDPFLGSGTTGIAVALESALLEGEGLALASSGSSFHPSPSKSALRFLGMEQDEGYAAIAAARIAWWAEHGEEALHIVAERERAESERAEVREAGQLELL